MGDPVSPLRREARRWRRGARAGSRAPRRTPGAVAGARACRASPRRHRRRGPPARRSGRAPRSTASQVSSGSSGPSSREHCGGRVRHRGSFGSALPKPGRWPGRLGSAGVVQSLVQRSAGGAPALGEHVDGHALRARPPPAPRAGVGQLLRMAARMRAQELVALGAVVAARRRSSASSGHVSVVSATSRPLPGSPAHLRDASRIANL